MNNKLTITGIIAEYNPFHNGHQYHLDEARRLTNADYIVCAMSGNFTQRGTPAIFDKFTRAKECLSGGADLVIELPVSIATGSAAVFAFGAVSILNRMQCTHIVFGVETSKENLIYKIAEVLNQEPLSVSNEIKKSRKKRYILSKSARNSTLSLFK